jgi:hypothetical protein
MASMPPTLFLPVANLPTLVVLYTNSGAGPRSVRADVSMQRFVSGTNMVFDFGS